MPSIRRKQRPRYKTKKSTQTLRRTERECIMGERRKMDDSTFESSGDEATKAQCDGSSEPNHATGDQKTITSIVSGPVTEGPVQTQLQDAVIRTSTPEVAATTQELPTRVEQPLATLLTVEQTEQQMRARQPRPFIMQPVLRVLVD
jgi:hypothetical protein